jgi:hypothetical protein
MGIGGQGILIDQSIPAAIQALPLVHLKSHFPDLQIALDHPGIMEFMAL